MNDHLPTACVTGASGMVGGPIVRRLVSEGYRVRILTRQPHYQIKNVEIIQGDILNENVLRRFMKDAAMVFHCAAELKVESSMWDVNVLGTEKILKIAKNFPPRYFCYLSSAGVVGQADDKWVDENSDCHPQNAYEKSKWAAEQMVRKGIAGCRVVALRPTNVIDDNNPGALNLTIHPSLQNRVKVFLKGGECAHIVHAEDVAAAALYFISSAIEKTRCYFVSYDNEALNTYAGLNALFKAYTAGKPDAGSLRPALHLPVIIPHLLRRLWRGKGSRGDIRYSPKRLNSSGFEYAVGFKRAVGKVFAKHRPEYL